MENQLRKIKARQDLIDAIVNSDEDASIVLVIECDSGYDLYRRNAWDSTAIGMLEKGKCLLLKSTNGNE